MLHALLATMGVLAILVSIAAKLLKPRADAAVDDEVAADGPAPAVSSARDARACRRGRARARVRGRAR